MKKKTTKQPKRTRITIQKSTKYGKPFYGRWFFHEGKRPKWLHEDGFFKLGKHLFETLTARFGQNFRLVLTKDRNLTERRGDTLWIYISEGLLDRMKELEMERGRDLKLDVVRRLLSATFPGLFATESAEPYVPGTIARVLDTASVSGMSSEDKEAVKKMLPDFVVAESIKSVNLLKASAQIKSLREVEAELQEAMGVKHPESWWQDYIRERILIIQQGYIQSVEKLNVGIGTKKLPDFLLVTHDEYVDILEIKRPDTPLLLHDASRDNYYWSKDMAKAVSQVENYITLVDDHRDEICRYLKDKHGLDLRILRPRGIILAGNANEFTNAKMRDDFRMLAHGMKNVAVLTYDELLTRLSNYIHVLETSVVKED